MNSKSDPPFARSIDKDDSINGSKTTTESNTPENTVRLESMGQKPNHSFHIENNEVVLESESLIFELLAESKV